MTLIPISFSKTVFVCSQLLKLYPMDLAKNQLTANCDCSTFLNGRHIHIPKDLMYLAGVFQQIKH